MFCSVLAGYFSEFKFLRQLSSYFVRGPQRSVGEWSHDKGIKQPTNGFVDSKAVSLHDVVVVHTNRRI